jgi:hypothetical protein
VGCCPVPELRHSWPNEHGNPGQQCREGPLRPPGEPEAKDRQAVPGEHFKPRATLPSVVPRAHPPTRDTTRDTSGQRSPGARRSTPSAAPVGEQKNVREAAPVATDQLPDDRVESARYRRRQGWTSLHLPHFFLLSYTRDCRDGRSYSWLHHASPRHAVSALRSLQLAVRVFPIPAVSEEPPAGRFR